MTGKLIGICLVGLTQLAIWIGTALASSLLPASSPP